MIRSWGKLSKIPTLQTAQESGPQLKHTHINIHQCNVYSKMSDFKDSQKLHWSCNMVLTHTDYDSAIALRDDTRAHV